MRVGTAHHTFFQKPLGAAVPHFPSLDGYLHFGTGTAESSMMLTGQLIKWGARFE
jgi:hypothetical protein